jgi:GTP-binding protein
VIATSSATGLGLKELSSELLRRVAPRGTGAEPTAETPVAGVPADRPAVLGANGSHAAPAHDSGDRGAGEEALAEHMVFRPAGGSGFRVERLGPRSFAVRGKGIERLLARFDLDNEDAMAYLEGRLRRIGVLKALELEGFQPGDEIEIAGVTLELDPS